MTRRRKVAIGNKGRSSKPLSIRFNQHLSDKVVKQDKKERSKKHLVLRRGGTMVECALPTLTAPV